MHVLVAGREVVERSEQGKRLHSGGKRRASCKLEQLANWVVAVVAKEKLGRLFCCGSLLFCCCPCCLLSCLRLLLRRRRGCGR